MRTPDDLRAQIGRDFARRDNLDSWLRFRAGQGEPPGPWPRTYGLGPPSQEQAEDYEAFSRFVASWRDLGLPGRVSWVEKSWSRLGRQTVPRTLSIDGPGDLARWAGQEERWARLEARYLALLGRWPVLAEVLAGHLGDLADYPEEDFDRISKVLGWLERNPSSFLYPRQLPIAGLDSKWLESRMRFMAGLAAPILGREAAGKDFHEICALKRRTGLVRLRLLDPGLRAAVGGLGQLAVPREALAGLPLAPRTVVMVENLETGLAFGDLPGTVLILGQGNGLKGLGQIPWLLAAERHLYWGDIDLAGLAILGRARRQVPGLASVLMDEATLMANRDLWGTDSSLAIEEPAFLTPQELDLFRALSSGRFGPRVRLEQERIAWDRAWPSFLSLAGQ
ncbi:MAG: DUF2220 family protein [Deltaproteobacteria bacterium]|jgi:hypothetical protein|nr:DUF2220 family protein [Deltaproteobacteria bacterium]